MSLKKQALSGIVWTYFEMFGGQAINFFVNIILARKLIPDDYGLLGMIFIFITISNTLMDTGISISVLRSKEVNEKDYSTLFVSNLGISVGIYIILFLIAPSIASFYNQEIITSLIRVFGITVIIQAFVQVQSIYLQKNLNFKKQSLMKLPSIILSSIIAIAMAYNGFGVWSLVWMYLLQNFFWALFHWVFGEWNPRLGFSKHIFKAHFGYGYRLTLVELMNNVTANIYQIVIGKYYSVAFVGYFSQALTLRQLPVSNIYGPIMKVLFPVFSQIQDDKNKFSSVFYRSQEILILILYPVFIFMIYYAEEVLVLIFSEKWGAAAFYLQVLCVAGFFNILVNSNLLALKIIGNTKQILNYEVFFKGLLIAFIGIAILLEKDVKLLLYTVPLAPLVAYLIYNQKVSKLLQKNVLNNTLVVVQFIILSSFSLLITVFLDKLYYIKQDILYIVVHGVIYVGMYLLLVYFFKRQSITNLFFLIKKS